MSRSVSGRLRIKYRLAYQVMESIAKGKFHVTAGSTVLYLV